MGADRTITLYKPVTPERLESILTLADIKWSRKNEDWWQSQYPQWFTHLDIDLREGGRKIMLGYAYWGEAHAAAAELECEKLIQQLRRLHMLRGAGRWYY